MTFGTVTATAGPFGGVYRAVLRALADQPVRVLLTTGAGLDPAELWPLPPNTRVERWWPQHDVLPHAAAVIGHGGFGTTMGAVAAGVPQVVLPLFSHDQFVNAAHVEAAGAGVRLEGDPPPVDELPAALARLLATSSYRSRAQEVAGQMASLPPVSECVLALEEIARS